MLRSIAIATLIFASVTFVWAGDGNTFQWQGEMTPGQTLAIRGISGNVTADLAPDTLAQVTATISDASQAQVQAVATDDGVLICEVFPGFPNGQADTCGGHSTSLVRNPAQVTITVHVPAGVALDVAIVSGDIRATGLTGDFKGATVNGQIAISVNGSAQASTVNGSIVAVLGSVEWTGTRSFTTLNGSIDATIPASADVTVHAATVRGTVSSDFPLSANGFGGVSCGMAPTLNGTLGSGGRNLDLTTVNGSIHLRKAK